MVGTGGPTYRSTGAPEGEILSTVCLIKSISGCAVVFCPFFKDTHLLLQARDEERFFMRDPVVLVAEPRGTRQRDAGRNVCEKALHRALVCHVLCVDETARAGMVCPCCVFENAQLLCERVLLAGGGKEMATRMLYSASSHFWRWNARLFTVKRRMRLRCAGSVLASSGK